MESCRPSDHSPRRCAECVSADRIAYLREALVAAEAALAKATAEVKYLREHREWDRKWRADARLMVAAGVAAWLAVELHIGCGGEVRLEDDRWRCQLCRRGPISVEETLLCLRPVDEPRTEGK